MLELSGLDALYGSSHILHGINLSVGEAERVAVLGRNGAGKTTLLKSILDAGPTTRGGITWKGNSLASSPAYQRVRQGISLVPEDRRIFAHLTVVENLELAREGVMAGESSLDAETVLTRFPMLEALRSRYGNQLSGGQQQMLAIARGLVPRPRLLLVDEPTEGLAPVIVQQLARLINAICQESGIALLLSEQNLWFARRCTDYVHVIDSGVMVFSGDWAAFDADPSVKSRYLAV